MKKILLFLSTISILVACGDIENSSTSDELYYSESLGGPVFAEASIVLKKYCIQCHEFAGYSEIELASLTTESGTPYVVADSLIQSYLYTKIRGNKATTNGNMPTNGSVPASEIRKIENWILSL